MLDDFQLADWWEGINENQKSVERTLYPNPTKGEVTIINNFKEVSDYSLEIIAISGKTVLKQEIHSNHITLNLPSGYYTVNLKDNENIYIKKSIIKKIAANCLFNDGLCYENEYFSSKYKSLRAERFGF